AGAGRERALHVARRDPGVSDRAAPLALASLRTRLRRLRGRDPGPRLLSLRAHGSARVPARARVALRRARRTRAADRTSPGRVPRARLAGDRRAAAVRDALRRLRR